MSGNDAPISNWEVFFMYNNGFCGGNMCWIIILLLLFCNCGGTNTLSGGCGCGHDRCDNGCGGCC